MSDADRTRWDARYRDGAYQNRTHPSAYIEEQAAALPRGVTLDLACGAGRNAIYLASLGCRVEGWDISSEALARARTRGEELGLDILWRACDLDRVELPRAHYDLIVQVRYVNLELMAPIVNALRPGGVYLCEQHLVSDREVVGPSNPAFRMDPDELRDAVTGLCAATGLCIEDYREEHIADPDGRPAALVRMLARRPG
jgi:SAM-dependent methyltransferase